MADYFGGPIGMPFPVTGALSFNTVVLNQTTDALEVITQLPPDTYTHIFFRQGTVTGTPGNLRSSVQGVTSAPYIPDGTIASSGNAFNDYTPSSGNNNLGLWRALGTSYVQSGNNPVSLVIAPQAGTWDGSNNMTIGQFIGNTPTGQTPYSYFNDNGVRTAEGRIPVIGIRSATRTLLFPIQNITAQTFNSGSTPDEYGIAFTLPITQGSTFKVRGIYLPFTQGTTHNTKVQLYSNTTVLQTFTYSSAYQTSSSGRPGYLWLADSSVTLNNGTQYIIGIQPQDATNFTIYYTDVNAAADMDAFPGGQAIYTATRVDVGSWSFTTTRRINAAILIDDITIASSGMLYIPNLDGI